VDASTEKDRFADMAAQAGDLDALALGAALGLVEGERTIVVDRLVDFGGSPLGSQFFFAGSAFGGLSRFLGQLCLLLELALGGTLRGGTGVD